MNTLVIVVIAACCLAAGYLLYGRWLAHKWGIDPNAKTPAVTKEDGQDYVPTDVGAVDLTPWKYRHIVCIIGIILAIGIYILFSPIGIAA